MKSFYRSCLSKTKFTTYERACKVASQYKQRVYTCRYCSFYHLTSREKFEEDKPDYVIDDFHEFIHIRTLSKSKRKKLRKDGWTQSGSYYIRRIN